MGMSFALELRGVAKRFVAGTQGCRASVDVLRAVDLELHAGEAVAILGGMGSGKSTLLLCAAGLLRFDAGRVEWFGRPDRTRGSERATYYFPGGTVRPRPAATVAMRMPHIHLVDGLESLSLTSVSRVEQWITRRTTAGDAVLVATRDALAARELATRVIVLRHGRLNAAERVAAARVAEPIEWGPR